MINISVNKLISAFVSLPVPHLLIIEKRDDIEF